MIPQNTAPARSLQPTQMAQQTRAKTAAFRKADQDC